MNRPAAEVGYNSVGAPAPSSTPRCRAANIDPWDRLQPGRRHFGRYRCSEFTGLFPAKAGPTKIIRTQNVVSCLMRARLGLGGIPTIRVTRSVNSNPGSIPQRVIPTTSEQSGAHYRRNAAQTKPRFHRRMRITTPHPAFGTMRSSLITRRDSCCSAHCLS